jgi:TATA-binding protein-associated factor
VKHATVADIARLEGVSPEQAVERAAHLQPTTDDDDDAAGDLAFAEFDIVGVLERAAPLLAAKSGDEELFGGADDDKDDAKKQLSKAERLRLAKQTLKQRLGMALDSTLEGAAEDEDGGKTKRAEKSSDGGDDAGQTSVKANLDVDKFVDVDDLVGEEDVDEVKVEPRDDAEKKMDASDLTQLSARERNRLKRKMKRGARDAADGVEPAAKRGRKPGSGSSTKGGSSRNSVDPETAARLAAEAAEEEDEAAEVEAGGWPLARTCEKLAYSLFAPRWEERHGAAAALREVLRTHAASAAVPGPPPRARSVEPDTAAKAARKNASWLEDAAVRLLCVLSLDRFGDYVGDGVVAPVRETGAQALGAGLLPLPPKAVEAVVGCILVLLRRPEWEVRHSALLALRYVLAARDALAPRLLPAALPAATSALDDKDDDVRGAAAEALLPAARHLPTHGDFPPLLAGLWGLLGRLDDPDLLTSPSNVPVMRRVSALYALPATRSTPPKGPGSTLRDVVPSLFPFAAHPIASVRLAVWQTLGQLMHGGDPSGRDWVNDVAATAMRVSFQATLLEEDAETAAAASAAWRDLCHVASAGAVAAAVDAHVEGWCALAATAADARPDARLLCVVSLSGGAGGTITGADDRAPTSTSEWGVVTTIGRLRAVEALSQLAKVLCAPGAAGELPISDAAAKLEAQVTRLLREGSATRRLTGSFLLASWLDAIPEGAPKPPLAAPGARLGELLAATDPAYPSAPSPAPYAEVASLVARVKRESAGLLRAAADNNVKPTTAEVPSPAADGFGAAHAATLAAAIPTVRVVSLAFRFSFGFRFFSEFRLRRARDASASLRARRRRSTRATRPELPHAGCSPRAKGHSRFPHA